MVRSERISGFGEAHQDMKDETTAASEFAALKLTFVLSEKENEDRNLFSLSDSLRFPIGKFFLFPKQRLWQAVATAIYPKRREKGEEDDDEIRMRENDDEGNTVTRRTESK